MELTLLTKHVSMLLRYLTDLRYTILRKQTWNNFLRHPLKIEYVDVSPVGLSLGPETPFSYITVYLIPLTWIS